MVERTAPRLKMNIRKRTISILISTFVILFVMIGTGIFIDPEKISIHLMEKNQAPSLSHLFGTDWLGRDMLLRTLKGLTLSFGVGVLAAFSSTVIALLRSEEHTSELQSRGHLVCRLLLEKKKNNK